MNNSDNLLNQIQKLQDDYYSTNSKNMFFKEKQKFDCASNISNQMDVKQLIMHTLYIIPNTNKIFIDYPVFKTYIFPELYETFIEYCISLMHYCIEIYNCFEIHININSFSISACHRYKNAIIMFNNNCIHSNNDFSLKLNKMYIYNTPKTMKDIITFLTPFMDQNIKNKIVFFNKDESTQLLQQLL